MSWDEGQQTDRRPRRTPIIVAGIVVAVLALGLLTRQAPPDDTFAIETEQPTEGSEPSPPFTVTEGTIDTDFPRDTGLTLWAINVEGDLARVNLDTGETVAGQVVEGRVDAAALLPAGDGVVVVSTRFTEESIGGEARYVTGFDLAPITLGPAWHALPSPAPGQVWLLETAPAAPIQMREVTLDGAVVSEVTLPTGVSAHAAVEGGLLVNPPGSIIVYDPVTQQGRSIADGTVLAADPQRLLRRVCDEQLRCRATMGPVAVPDAAQVTLPAEAEQAMAAGFAQATLSPTGRWVALIVFDPEFRQPHLAVVDVTNGQLRAAPDRMALGDRAFGPFATNFAWAPSGEWLFAVDDSGAVTAWNLLDDRLAPIDVDLPGLAGIAVS